MGSGGQASCWVGPTPEMGQDRLWDRPLEALHSQAGPSVTGGDSWVAHVLTGPLTRRPGSRILPSESPATRDQFLCRRGSFHTVQASVRAAGAMRPLLRDSGTTIAHKGSHTSYPALLSRHPKAVSALLPGTSMHSSLVKSSWYLSASNRHNCFRGMNPRGLRTRVNKMKKRQIYSCCLQILFSNSGRIKRPSKHPRFQLSQCDHPRDTRIFL